MQKIRYFPVTLIAAAAILAGCSSMPQNSALSEAHSNYARVSTNPEVTRLAPAELKDASDSLSKADNALTEGESTSLVDHLAYIAKQKTDIALETAKRKTDELVVTNAAAQRSKIQLEARTNEADSAKQELAVQDEQLKALNAKETKHGMVITLGDLLFSTDKSTVASGGMRNLQKLDDFLQHYPKYKIQVEGYTDSTGSDSHNQELSEKRANAVRTALLDGGLSNDRVTSQGYGKDFPVASNQTAAGRQMNRRVEIVFSDANGNITPH
ncbi:MAG: OmpA family protein [Ferrovum sp.]|nr:OmpA family protein [Ferrovum sp.]NDU87051.1 OmpA family protein [Ferrovum sp.]